MLRCCNYSSAVTTATATRKVVDHSGQPVTTRRSGSSGVPARSRRQRALCRRRGPLAPADGHRIQGASTQARKRAIQSPREHITRTGAWARSGSKPPLFDECELARALCWVSTDLPTSKLNHPPTNRAGWPHAPMIPPCHVLSSAACPPAAPPTPTAPALRRSGAKEG